MSENPTPEAVAAIVKGLSKAQREALFSKRLPSSLANPINRTHYALMGDRPLVPHALARKGLLDVFTDSYGDRHSGISTEHRFALTRLGLAVRQALTGEDA